MRDAPRIVGIGMSVLDSTHLLDAFPEGSGVTEMGEGTLSGGGPVPTALCAASRLGASSAAVERIGDDWRGDLIVADYGKYGVDVSSVLRQPRGTTSAATVLVRRHDGERHILYERGDAPELVPEELPSETLRRCRILHLNGRHPEASLAAAMIVRENGGLVSFDGGAHRYRPDLEPLIAIADVLVVALDFAARRQERLTVRSAPQNPDGRSQLLALAEASPSARLLGVTDGARGAWLLDRDADPAPWHQPALDPGEIIDTTGCGDVFHGALLAARCEGTPWREAARFASAAAAIAATALGGRGRLPGLDEVAALLENSEERRGPRAYG
jgi:sulfofructose kinase